MYVAVQNNQMLNVVIDKFILMYFQPFNATRINAAAIEDRVKVLQKQNQNVSGKAGFYEEFEVRKTKTAVLSIVLKDPC